MIIKHHSVNEENYISNVNRKKIRDLAMNLYGRKLNNECENEAPSLISLARSVTVETFKVFKKENLTNTTLEKIICSPPIGFRKVLKKQIITA